MKKTIFVLICILLLVFPVLAGGQSIVDEADLLGESQVSRLEEHAQQIEESYNIDIVILTAPTTYDVDAAAFADEFYLTNGYGDNGILLLLVMDSRDWVISTWGKIADTMSTSDCDSLFASAADYISAGDYERGFERYLDQLPMYVYPPHTNGVPKEMPDWGKLGIALLIGSVVAGIVLIVMISSMRTARSKRSAAEYVNRDSFRIPVQRDLYLYSTTTRTKSVTASPEDEATIKELQKSAVFRNTNMAAAQPAAVPQNGWTCACGHVNTGKFCSECGDRFDDSDIQ